MKKLYTLLFLALSIHFSFATTRNVPGTYATIQLALAACATGDTIMVQPGTYPCNVTWPNVANIKMKSVGDSSNTFLDGGAAGCVLTFSAVLVDTNTYINGFTITNGKVTGSAAYGGGISITNCSPKFKKCAITNNHINATNWGYGAGVYCSNSSVYFLLCSIWKNKADTCTWGYGGGIYLSGGGSPKFVDVKINSNRVNSNSWCYGTGVYCDGSNANFTRVSVSNNTTGAGALWYYGTGIYFNACTSTLTNVLVASNVQNNSGSFYYGAGIYSNGTSGTITMMNCTVTNNTRTNSGPINGPGLYTYTGSTVVATNCIFYDNNNGTEVMNGGGTITITYSDVRGGFVGTGNINSSALFVSATDFHLTVPSPCVNAGTLAGSPNNDLDVAARPMPVSTNPDMGCYELNQPLTAVAGIVNEFFSLQTYPNPFNTTTAVHFSLSQTENVKVEVLDINGKLISVLLEGEYPKNEYVLKFDGADLKAGMYFCRMMIGNEVRVVKMMKE